MAQAVRIVFLGGLGEIGRNCALMEIEDRILILDCGIMFPDLEMLGIDLVLPDFTYLYENADRVEACVVTHGHEDHVGALSFLLRDISFPIYGSAFALGIARNRIEEAGVVDKTEFIVVQDNERRQIGPFDVEFIPVTHSVPQGFALGFHTPQGVILHSGDFKLDPHPVDGRLTDLSRIGAIAAESGVRLLLSDSTNAQETGHTPTESSVGQVLSTLFQKNVDKRIIVTCFASHIHRIQQIADAARATGRKIATLGRSMAKNVALALSLGILDIDSSAFIDIEDVGKFKDSEICVISTGSQGEPMSALSLMASGENKWLKITQRDLVILSSHAIPGNETAVGKVIDGLYRLGAEVIYPPLAQVHVSGHAMQGELETLLAVAKPEFFIPVHGEYRHLVTHSHIAQSMGVAPQNVLLAEDGDIVDLDDKGIDFGGTVPAGYFYLDGLIGNVGRGVLRDRKALSQEGVMVVVVTIDPTSGTVINEPQIMAKGWMYEDAADPIINEVRQEVLNSLSKIGSQVFNDQEILKNRIRKSVGKLIYQKTKLRPMIVPIVVEA